MQPYANQPVESLRPMSVLDDDSRARRAARVLWPIITGYVAIVLGLVYWAIGRPDHTSQIMDIMVPVIVMPFLSFVALLNSAKRHR